MIFENNTLVKECILKNASEICWKFYMDKKASDLAKVPVKFNITSSRSSTAVEVEVIITSVIDNGNNYWVQGKFYDDGNFYLFRTWYHKFKKTSQIDFIPWPNSAILDSELEYIEKLRRKS